MDSITKFNKASLGFYNDIIDDFSKKVKEAIPEEYHSVINELMVSNHKMLDDVKKVNKKMKKKTTATKKKAPSGWNLFYKAKQSSVEATKQENKMSLVGEMWKVLSSDEKEEWKAKANSSSVESSDAESQSETEGSSDEKSEAEASKNVTRKTEGKKTPAKKGEKKVKKGESVEVSDDDMPIMDASD